MPYVGGFEVDVGRDQVKVLLAKEWTCQKM